MRITEARQYIGEQVRRAVPARTTPNVYKTKKDAQDAHEAIRPTSVLHTPEEVAKYLAEDELKLYRLIWKRFVASQMMPAVFDQTTIDVSAKGKTGADYTFRATGSVPKFDGFLEVYQEGKDAPRRRRRGAEAQAARWLPKARCCSFKAIKPEQHFTEPPPRYNEATLVKKLESDGVGRPSTYASILSTIQEREYVTKEGGRFTPTELGMVVTDLLLESFNDIFDVKYTARMEEELDEIEDGKLDWRTAMGEFYERFTKDIEARRRAHDRHQADGEAHRLDVREVRQAAGDQVGQARQLHRLHRLSGLHLHARADGGPAGYRQARTDEQGEEEYCENCGRPMVLKKGRFGTFLACTGYPDCKTTKQIGGAQKKADVTLDEKCPQCDNNLVQKFGRFGEFTACSNYPTCKYVKQKTIGVKCPECSRRRNHRAALEEGQDFLRLHPLSRLQFRRLGQARGREVPGVRRRLHGGEVAEGGPGPAMPERGVQV